VNWHKIGQGAFGEVFVATEVTSGQRVAVKKMAVTPKNQKHLLTEIDIQCVLMTWIYSLILETCISIVFDRQMLIRLLCLSFFFFFFF
jgi:hypothetical protein